MNDETLGFLYKEEKVVTPVNTALEIKAMLARMTGLDVEEIKEDDVLVDDLGIDSLKVIEIATYIEKTYKVKVKESQMARIRTVRDAVAILNELITGRNASA